MTATELLIPRYEIIADFPGNKYNVGRIITPITKSNVMFDCPDAPSSEIIQYPEKYPYLFKRIPWWQNRDVKDMPEYVIFHDNTISKIKHWNMTHLMGTTDDGCVLLTAWNWEKGFGYNPIDECLVKSQLGYNELKWVNRYSDTDEPDKHGRLARKLFYRKKHFCLITLESNLPIKKYKVYDYFPSNGNDSPCYSGLEDHDLTVLMHRAEQRLLKFLSDIA